MHRFIGITGTPGTGKKTIAPLVAAKLGIKSYSLNDLVLPRNSAVYEAEGFEVDLAVLKRKVAGLPRDLAVLYGHLLPDVVDRSDLESAVVLRCEPSVLRKRLEHRGYSREKVAENIEAELIGVVSALVEKRFGRARVFEFDTTQKGPKGAASSISRLLAGGRTRRSQIDWTLLYDSASKLRSLLDPPSVGSART